MANGESMNPITVNTNRITVALNDDRVAPHKTSPVITSYMDSGVAIIASYSPRIAMRA